MPDFDSIEAFVQFLENLPKAVVAARASGLENASKTLQEASRASLGEYQESEGPFVGWQQLSEVTMELREQHGFPADEPLLVTEALHDHILREVDAAAGEAAVGVPSVMVGSGGGTGWENADHPRDIGEVALAHEFGIPGHIPQRSFLGLPAARLHDNLIEEMVAPIVEALSGHMP